MIYKEIPLLIPVLAMAYLMTVYLLLTLVQRGAKLP